MRGRAGEYAALGGVVALAAAAVVGAAAHGASPTVPFLVGAGSVTLAVAAHLLRREPEQARHAALLWTAALLLLASVTEFLSDGLPARLAAGALWWCVLPVGVVLLTYPGQRVVRRWHGLLLVAVGAHFVLGWPVVLWATDGGGAAALRAAWIAAGVALPVLACAAFVQRLRLAAPPERAAVRSVTLVGLALAGTFAVRLVARLLTDTGPLAAAVDRFAVPVNLAVLGLAPVGLLLEALRRRAARADTVDRLLRARGDRERVRAATAAALADPTLTLLGPDAAGAPSPPGRVRRVLRADGAGGADGTDGGTGGVGEVVAVVDADASTVRDPAQLRVVLAAAGLALDHDRLRDDLARSLAEVRASRERIVEAVVRSRRALERDLHDGAQQQLLAVATTLARAELEATEQRRLVAVREAREQLVAALGELRRLARGIHPAVLSQGGLAAALPTLADAASVPVDVHAPAVRLPAPVESTLWFVAAEAVANAVRHAEPGAIRVRLEVGDGRAAVTVSDDGRGGARSRPGGGLAGLADRVQALGGSLAVASAPGNGTTVEAVLACAS